MPNRSIDDVLEEKTAQWMTIPGVVGTAIGICADEPCIKVYLSARASELTQEFPNHVEGYRIVLQETGKFRA